MQPTRLAQQTAPTVVESGQALANRRIPDGRPTHNDHRKPGDVTESNWAANLDYAATAVHRPVSVEEVQELVAAHPRVRPLGTRHSFTDIADSPGGILISLEDLPADIQVDHDAGTVSVNPGTTYAVLAGRLEEEGLALPNLASLPHISIGGAIATATHGSGDTNGILATSVAAIEVVRGDGSLTRVDRTSTDLPALAVGLGAFGVYTRVELDVEPTYAVAQHIYTNASWESTIEDLDEIMASAYSVSLLGDIGASRMRNLWLKHKIGREPRGFPSTIHGGSRIDDTALPHGHSLTRIGGVPGPWSRRMAHFRPDAPPSAGGDELQTEYFVDRRHGRDAMRVLRSMGDRISPHLRAMEIRSLAADDLWLSPAYRRPSLCLGFTWHKHPEAVEALLPEIEAALDDFEPRPHWGKLFALGDLADRFPRLGDFLGLAAAYDTTRTFWNPFMDRLAGSEGQD
ncbi:MAG: FAD-binding protein [Acidimicrobiia bacterium]|nr:FAD-binding protein [Acidimicrobiia bacterium]